MKKALKYIAVAICAGIIAYSLFCIAIDCTCKQNAFNTSQISPFDTSLNLY